jgi:hypothetical protein
MAHGLLYYRHSGWISTGSLCAGWGLALLLGMGLAAGYAVFIHFCTLIYANAFAAGACGLIIGWVVNTVLRGFAIRNRPVAWLIILTTATAVLWMAWLVWVAIFLPTIGANGISFWQLALRPKLLWEIIGFINSIGAWSFRGRAGVNPNTVKGAGLAMVWLCEAALLVGPMIWMSVQDFRGAPFCENCKRWCGQVAFAALRAGDEDALRGKLELHEIGALEDLGKAEEGATEWTRVTVQACPKCTEFRTLCVESVLETANPAKPKVRSIVEGLLISEAEARQVVALGERLEKEGAMDG